MSRFKLIVGPPGTGKTTYLLKILEDELNRNSPDEIAFVSFTRTGSYEGRDRAIERFNYNIDDLPYFRTLHSIAYRQLNIKQGNMFNNKDRIRLGKLIGYNFKNNFTADLNKNDSLYLFYIDAYRNNPELGKLIVDNYYLNINNLMEIESNYREYKKEFGKFDYTDLIEMFIEKNNPLPVKVAIVDEAQDLTSLQWQMVNVAFRNCSVIYIAGDDDQAIYEWSGADVKTFIKTKGDITTLDHSYRLPEKILDFSKTISCNIKNRISKDFEPAEEGGTVSRIGPDLIDDFYNGSISINDEESYLFLSRNRYYLKDFKDVLIRTGKLFNYEGVPFHKKEEIKAINIYTRIQRDKKVSLTDKNLLKRYIIPGITDFNSNWYDALKIPEDRIEHYRMILQNKTDPTEDPKIDIRTIHSVKGAEADNVFLHLNITNAVKNNLIHNPDSEHRVFYVGATRAKKSLTIVLPNQKNFYDIDYRWLRRNELEKYKDLWGYIE